MKKYINQVDMKKANTADIFSLIRKSGRITRKEIEAKTGFSWGAVSTITSHLLEANYIREFKCKQAKSAGRTPSYLEVNSKDHFVLGVDINISGFKSVLINLKNEVIGNNFYKTAYSDKNSLLSEIISFIKESISLADNKNIIGIGIAMQGQVDAKNGISISIPHCKDWSNVPLAYIISKEFNVPAFIEHDPNCILYAISTDQIYRDAILLRVDKGIGMSVLLSGKIFDKPGMFEIGHTIAVPNGMLCSCGKQGCLEAYASMSGMSALSGCRFDELVKKARDGDKESLSIFYDMANHLAVAVLNASHMLCISKIVLCGEIWQYKDLFYDTFLNRLKENDSKSSLDVSFIDIENAATGAALIAIEHSIKYMNLRKEDE